MMMGRRYCYRSCPPENAAEKAHCANIVVDRHLLERNIRAVLW